MPEATRSARVRAKSDVRCLAIGANDFKQLLQRRAADRARDAARRRRAALARTQRRLTRVRPVPTTCDVAEKLIADNRRARHDYELLERVEAGLVLTGTEVKSLRQGRATLGQAYADVRDGEAWLHGAEIAVYDQGNRANHEPTRPRKLLLHRREIDRLYGQVREKGLTLVPTRLYFKDGRVKVELALARGKDVRDKRRTIADRDAKRQIERAMKARR